MLPGTPNKESLASAKEIEMPLHIILIFAMVWILSYGIHLDTHFLYFWSFDQHFILDIQF